MADGINETSISIVNNDNNSTLHRTAHAQAISGHLQDEGREQEALERHP
jgi:hypothetical protein